MKCPSCNADDDSVVDSREADGGAAVRRRRECNRCGRRFTTYERVERAERLVVVKKDGTRVPFSADNVMRGIVAACGKRPIPEERKVAVVREVEDELGREFDREVSSTEIGRRVAAKLRAIDAIAYIRFASEHEDFRTLEDIAAEVRAVQESPRDMRDQRRLFDG
ncbi:MAG: transcriptional regulator NrdR [Planctomycetaceae bacterium]|nr:transcriptional regulator NrdR [Planctomycetaceae bacterium]